MSNCNPHPTPPTVSVIDSTTNRVLHEADPDQRRDSTDSDLIHHFNFEDDGFFPPRWIGKDSQQMSDQRTGSIDSRCDPRDTSAHKSEAKT
ncbi:hypothetical protein N7475_004322 [Penicillium sp. IBT 31633x]|nr:hypothetical protein N7475_004322 [Penicillium sp. IBT 31633x]